MLGAGLRREFPGAFERASRLRGPRLARERLAWAVLSAIGAALLVVDMVYVVLWSGIAFSVDVRLPVPTFQLRDVLATSAAVAVALRAGGPLALVLYIGYVLVGLLVGLPGTLRFCERAGGQFDFCTAPGFLLGRWPDLAGLAVGLVAFRGLGERSGTNALLATVGTYALMTFPGRLGFAVADGPQLERPVDAMAVGAIVSLLAGVVAALVLRARGGHLWHAVFVAAVIALAWLLPNAPLFHGGYDMPPGETALAVISGVGGAAALAVTALLTAALSRSRRPGADAARRAPR